VVTLRQTKAGKVQHAPLSAEAVDILTDLLRGKLGFDGLVVSDYFAIDMIHNYHRVADNLRSAAVRALTAGIDMELPTRSCYGDPLREALEANEIVIRSTKEPVGGKVNKELVNELSRLFHRQVELVSGFSSKDKKLLVKGARKGEIEDSMKHV
jgi:uncharacterized protein (TIGR00251 family)